MNYEKFNYAMCRLRQAEEEFNKALQDIQIVFNEYEKDIKEETKQARWEPWSFDNVVKETKDQDLREKEERQVELQAQIDEAYNKGLKDMHEAISFIATDVSDGGMSVFELKDAFGTPSVIDIILGFTPEEIIDKTLAWITKRKESQELHVGDEVIADYGIVGIITDVGDGNGIVWVTYRLTPAARGFDFCWANSAKCKKTGRHFDSIPFDYNSEKEEENK